MKPPEENRRHLRSQVEPAGHSVGHRRPRGFDVRPRHVPPTRQEEELPDVEENGVDLNQQRHHGEAHKEAERH